MEVLDEQHLHNGGGGAYYSPPSFWCEFTAPVDRRVSAPHLCLFCGKCETERNMCMKCTARHYRRHYLTHEEKKYNCGQCHRFRRFFASVRGIKTICVNCYWDNREEAEKLRGKFLTQKDDDDWKASEAMWKVARKAGMVLSNAELNAIRSSVLSPPPKELPPPPPASSDSSSSAHQDYYWSYSMNMDASVEGV